MCTKTIIAIITPILEIDVGSFQYLTGDFFRDKDHLFCKHEIIEELNVDSLVFMNKNSKGIRWKDGYSMIRDHKTVCYYNDIIENMDMPTLQVFKSPYSDYYGIKDKNWIYQKRNAIGYIKLSAKIAEIHVQSEI